MPNGNIMLLGVEILSVEKQIEMGRDPAHAQICSANDSQEVRRYHRNVTCLLFVEWR